MTARAIIRHHALAALTAAFVAAPLAGQSDTVRVTIYDEADLRIQYSPGSEVRGLAGDTLTFAAVVVDTLSGDTLDLVLRWRTDSPGVVALDSITGFATFLASGTANVWAEALGFNGVVMFGQLNGVGDWELILGGEFADYLGVPRRSYQVPVGDSAQLCAYAVRGGRVLEKSLRLCPDRVLGNVGPLPAAEDDFGSFLERFAYRTPARR